MHLYPFQHALLLPLGFLSVMEISYARASTSAESLDRPANRREQAMTDAFAIELASSTNYGDQGVMLTFAHGNGGTPMYKIFAAGDPNLSFDPASALTGQTCRSQSGQMPASTSGMAVFETANGLTETVLAIDVDMANLADVFFSDDGVDTVIQYCVYFALKTAPDDWEANFVETEIRFVIRHDGSISVESFGNSMAQPLTRDFTTTFGLKAEICNTPSGQGDIVSVCINVTDSFSAIGMVEEFAFVSDTGAVQQNAFVGGIAQSLTEVEYQDGYYLKFNTMLKADFYTSGLTTVNGQGMCTMSGGMRRSLQAREPALSEEEEIAVSLAFVIGEERLEQLDSSIHQDTTASSPKGETANGAANASITMPGLVAVIVVASLLGSAVSLVALALGIRYGHRSMAALAGESTTQTKRTERFEDDPIQQLADCLPITDPVYV